MIKYDYDSTYQMKESYINNEDYIKERVSNSGLERKVKRRAFENLLRVLYSCDHQGKPVRKTVRNYELNFSQTELIMLYRLATRSTGSERFNYGINAIKAIKRDKYKCVICGQNDVRCLEIDHIDGRTHSKGSREQHYETSHFQTLCANHHRIKTVIEKQQN